jgi:hypothetical protein
VICELDWLGAIGLIILELVCSCFDDEVRVLCNWQQTQAVSCDAGTLLALVGMDDIRRER